MKNWGVFKYWGALRKIYYKFFCAADEISLADTAILWNKSIPNKVFFIINQVKRNKHVCQMSHCKCGFSKGLNYIFNQDSFLNAHLLILKKINLSGVKNIYLLVGWSFKWSRAIRLTIILCFSIHQRLTNFLHVVLYINSLKKGRNTEPSSRSKFLEGNSKALKFWTSF